METRERILASYLFPSALTCRESNTHPLNIRKSTHNEFPKSSVPGMKQAHSAFVFDQSIRVYSKPDADQLTSKYWYQYLNIWEKDSNFSDDMPDNLNSIIRNNCYCSRRPGVTNLCWQQLQIIDVILLLNNLSTIVGSVPSCLHEKVLFDE